MPHRLRYAASVKGVRHETRCTRRRASDRTGHAFPGGLSGRAGRLLTGDYATALQEFKPLAEQGDAILIEAKAEYAEMARARLREDAGMFAEVQPA